MPNLNQTGYEDLTVADSAVQLASVPTGIPPRALIYVETAPIRWRADGTDPTASVGMYAPAGSYIDWTETGNQHQAMIAKFSAIRATDVSATLRCAYFS